MEHSLAKARHKLIFAEPPDTVATLLPSLREIGPLGCLVVLEHHLSLHLARIVFYCPTCHHFTLTDCSARLHFSDETIETETCQITI